MFLNKNYTCINNKVIISDENGNCTQVDYYKNIDKVLVHQNMLEVINKNIIELESIDTIDILYNRDSQFDYFKLLGAFSCSVLVLPLVGSFIPGFDMSVFLPALGEAVLLDSPFFAIFYYLSYKRFKAAKNKFNGIDSELAFLKKEKDKEEKIITDLLSVKEKNTQSINFDSREVQDKEAIDYLNRMAYFHYSLGYNYSDYHNYYENDKLDKKLEKTHTNDGIQTIKDFLNDKENVLVKKK